MRTRLEATLQNLLAQTCIESRYRARQDSSREDLQLHNVRANKALRELLDIDVLAAYRRRPCGAKRG